MSKRKFAPVAKNRSGTPLKYLEGLSGAEKKAKEKFNKRNDEKKDKKELKKKNSAKVEKDARSRDLKDS